MEIRGMIQERTPLQSAKLRSGETRMEEAEE